MHTLDSARSRGPGSILSDYISEKQYCAAVNKSRRTARAERQHGIGPPYVRWGKTILYPKPGFEVFLKSLKRWPAHMQRRSGAARCAKGAAA